VRAEAERKAVNSVVQGSAADLMKRAMVDWCRWAEAAGRPPARIVAQVGCGRACVV
jgi:DNA polymerase I-like protein with 3'-5' exonuclease and polymerase domains